MKKCIFFIALLMSSYVMNGMELDSVSRSASRDGIGERGEGNVSLSRESLRSSLEELGNKNQELKKRAERRCTVCKRVVNISFIVACVLFLTYKYNLCPFISGIY